MTDYLIVGLGNPGAEHANNRHNIGGMTVQRLARRHNINLKSQRNADLGKGRIGEAEVAIARPRNWYNNSGGVVAPLLKREGVPVENLIVVYDELDLPVGRIRMRPLGSAGGNNGLKSIIDAAGSDAFGRVRIGIGRPRHQGVPSWDPDVVMKHVLSNPTKAERELLDAAADRACDAIEAIVGSGWERAMNEYNTQPDIPEG